MKYHDHPFWKDYERVTAIAGWGFLITLIWTLLEAIFPGMMLTWPLMGEARYWLSGFLMWIIIADNIKYYITRDPRDQPFRKWWTFRNVKTPTFIIVKQRQNPSHISNLITAECPSCGALHGFERNDLETRLCGHGGCDEIIHAPHR